jgi:uncharacterized protein with ParB-like and HNH nuclease domain
MSYKRTTIKEIISNIDHNKLFLPALQRKFVWGKPQIELLFDSLMRNYPFGTFLFWKLHKKKASQYVFYDFLTEYDARDPYNKRRQGSFTHDEIFGVLDGQQRLSSMYVGLLGSHTEKAPYKHWDNPHAFEKMHLYLNLLSLPYRLNADKKIEIIEEQNYEFKFLSPETAKNQTKRRSNNESNTDEDVYWFKVGNCIDWEEDPDFDFIIDEIINQSCCNHQADKLKNNRRLVRKGLDLLNKRISEEQLINYFEIAKDDLEDILKIFVRVNSGGTTLSKTDLLFSTIVATWDDGREEIEDLQRRINEKGDKFHFGNEYIMRCCLILSDCPVVYKVHSFKSENVSRIQTEWPQIAQAIEKTVDTLVECGFCGETLTSQNATIIIAYYFYKGGQNDKSSVSEIRKYLVHTLLKGIFGTSQEQVFSALRNAFREEVTLPDGSKRYDGTFTNFSFEEVANIKLPSDKTLSVDDDDLNHFMEHRKGAASYQVLALLYPQLRYNEVNFHQDHIHPAAGFSADKLMALNLNNEEVERWLHLRDTVPNLQLLEDRRNKSKNATAFSDWLNKMHPEHIEPFCRDNYIPSEVGYEFTKFPAFYEAREKRLKEQLRTVLHMAPSKTLIHSHE